MRRALLLPLAGLLLSGCFSELLPDNEGSSLAFTCSVLNPARSRALVVQSWIADDVELDIAQAVATLRSELVDVTGRPPAEVGTVQRAGLEAPPSGWNETTVREWAETQSGPTGRQVTLRILWVPSLGDATLTGLALGPGVVALSDLAIRAGAQRLGADPSVVARVALLHFAGHALGVVNRGIPVQDPDIQSREGPPTHDPDPMSVLHAGWEDARSMTWAANATYDRYPDAIRADWAAALQPGGACA